MTNQKGFTLIELMISVAIVGILASVAVPQYQSYTGKTSAQSCYKELEGGKAGIESAIVNGDSFAAAADIGLRTDSGACFSSAATDITVVNGNSTADSTISAVLKSGHKDLFERVITLTRDLDDGRWTCSTDLEITGDARKKLLPALCLATTP